MAEYLADLLVNIAGNVIFWLALGLIIRYVIIRKTRAKFLKFFGLERSKELTVYLSNLWIRSVPERAGGCIISGYEFKVTKTVNSLFGNAPFRLPELVRGLVDSFWIGEKLEINIEVSPMDASFNRASNMIVVGAATKNSVRRDYLKNRMVLVTIAGESEEPLDDVHTSPLERHFVVQRGIRSGDLRRDGNHNIAVIEKVCDKDHDAVVFMCVGLRGDSSWAATEYLKRNWQALFAEFGDDSFARCLWFPYTEAPMKDYHEPSDTRDFRS